MRAGNTHHVTERRKNDVRIFRHRQSVVDPSRGQYAHGTAWSVDKLDIRRKQVLQAKAEDSMRVAAAHFHEPVVPLRIG